MNDPTRRKQNSGFTTIELLIGLVISSVVLTGLYRLWTNNSSESLKIQDKIELRNQFALSTKRINQSITVAGIGLNKVVGLQKADAIGSDTLYVYTNSAETKTQLQLSYNHGDPYLRVVSGSIFNGARYIAMTNGGIGEVRPIESVEGDRIDLASAFTNDFSTSGTFVMPATKEMFYSDQTNKKLVRVSNGSSPSIVAKNIHNFQVSFRDRSGEQTDDIRLVKFVNYSLTGVYTAREGSLNSIVFSSTSIPRNIF